MTNGVTQAETGETASATDEKSGGRRRPSFHVLKVGALDRITDDAVAITFEVPEQLREEYSYRAGQHVAVRATIAGDDVRRNYSICAPEGSGVLRIGVKRLIDGVFSNYAIERLRVGDGLEVLSPSGSFTADAEPGQGHHYGAVAAGSGITPILSILSTVLANDPTARATLIFVNVASNSIMFLEEIEDLKNAHLGRFQVFNVLDGERSETEVLSGRLDAERLTRILEGAGGKPVDSWYLCGPLPMTDMVRDTLVARGVSSEDIHRELFHTSSTPPAPRAKVSAEIVDKGSEVTVLLDGRATELTLPPNTDSILDAVRALRSEVPYACKNGVCGTCRCTLVEGTVEMAQNYALEADEVEAGYVLACQSYPTSQKVTVDFDQ